MFLVYLIKSDNKSYIGYTNDFFKDGNNIIVF